MRTYPSNAAFFLIFILLVKNLKTVTLRAEVRRGSFSRCNCRKKALAAAVFAIREGMRGHAVSAVLFFSFGKENILGAGRRFRLVLHVFLVLFWFCFLCRCVAPGEESRL